MCKWPSRGSARSPSATELRARLGGLSAAEARVEGWKAAKQAARCAREAGFAGVVLMGLKFETVVGEAYDIWHSAEVAEAGR